MINLLIHLRNMLSGVLQNYEVLGKEAFNPVTLVDSLATMIDHKATNYRKIITRGFKGTVKELYDKLTDRFKVSSQFRSDFTGAFDDPLEFKKLKATRKLGDWIELHQKANATIGALKKGFSLDEALDLAEKAGFDYSKVSKFEQDIMKRVFPFYSFARKNAGLQLSTAVEHPGRILNQIKFTNMLSGIFGGRKPSEEDIKGLPEWATNALGFKVGDNKLFSNFDVPIQEFLERVTDPIGTSFSSLNPIIKYPTEAFTGYDFFRKQQIAEVNKIAEPFAKLIESDKSPQWIKDLFDVVENEYEIDGEKKTVYKANPYALHLLRSIPTARMQNTFQRIVGDDEDLVNKLLSFFTGAKIYDIEQETQKYFRNRDLREEWEDYLIQHGKAFKSNRLFLKK